MKFNKTFTKTPLNESGIRIPKNTHGAKILHHQDFDGVFSAIITYRQLLKQGIKSENIITQGVQYGDTDSQWKKRLNRSKGQMVALVDFARLPKGSDEPDFWTDHHASGTERSVGGGRIGASEFKSDSAHLSLLHTENLVDSKTIDIVNKIDSAGYTDIKEILRLPKDFKQARRLERLGIISNALLTKTNLLKNDSLLEDFIKKTQPSIVSFYNNLLKYVRLDKIQSEAVKELSKENPDWEAVEKSRLLMPTMKSKIEIQPKNESLNESALEDWEELERLKNKNRNTEEEKRYRELINQPIDKLRKSRAKAARKEREGEGSFEDRGIALIQHNPRLQRYLWTQMNKAGVKYPFVIKRFPTLIQIAINPEIPQEIKEKIDLNAIAGDVMEKIKDKFQTKYNSWAFNIIEKERGGHKAITNLPAFGTLGIMKKKKREELKYLEALENRVKKIRDHRDLSPEKKERLNKALEMLDNKDTKPLDREYYEKLVRRLKPEMETLMPAKAKRLKELKVEKEQESEKRTQIMDEIEEEFIKILKQNFSDIHLTGGDEEWEFTESLDNILSF